MKEVRKLIAYDVSTTSTGFSVFSIEIEEKGSVKYSLFKSGTISLKKEKDINARIDLMISSILYQLNQYKPDYIAVEKPPYKNDPKTLICLSEIVGSIRGWAVYHGSYYKEYVPNRWRKLIADEEESIPIKRELCKPWDIQKVSQMFEIQALDDESDGILIGVAMIRELFFPFTQVTEERGFV